VSPRSYTLGARAVGIAETRRRVLSAARDLFLEHDVRMVTMNEVARRADVARATVYHQFGSKLGLVEALVEDLEQRAGLEALIAVVQDDPPARLIGSVIAAGCDYWATDPDLVRKISALGSLQHDVQALLAEHDSGRLTILTRMVERLAAARVLHSECAPEHAIDVLWVLTSFDAYDLLTRGRRLSHDTAADTLTRLAESELLRHRRR
jgi:AcrR family transcriptional regulator